MTSFLHHLLWVVAGGIASVVVALVFVGLQVRSVARFVEAAFAKVNANTELLNDWGRDLDQRFDAARSR